MTSGRAVFVVAVVSLATRLSLTGCDDADSHIYTGEPFDPTLGCLEPLTSIDVVTGPEPMTPCGPVCILSLPEDGGQIAYVSTMCAPYPVYPYDNNASSNPLCVAALDAFKRDALCEDGGVVLPPSDAGADADGPSGDGEASAPESGPSAVEGGLDATQD